MTVNIGSGSIPGSTGAGGGVPVGLPARAGVPLARLGVFRPDALMVPNDPFATFVLEPIDEADAFRRGYQLSGEVSNLLKPTRGAQSVITDGRALLKAVKLPGAAASTTNGVTTIPLNGIVNRTGFTLQAAISPQAADITTAGRFFPIYCKAGANSSSQLAYIDINGTSMTAFAGVDETSMPGGANVNLTTAAVTIATTDIPLGAWGVVWMTYNAGGDGKLRVGLHVYVDGSSGDIIKQGVSAGTNTALFKRPFTANPRLNGNGLFIGADRSASATVRDIKVAEVAAYPVGRIWAEQIMTPQENVTIDAAGTSLGAWNDKMTGIVGHYSGWDRSEAKEATNFAALTGGSAVRDAQIAQAGAAGCKAVRLAEGHERIAFALNATSPPGSVTSADTTDLVTHWRRFLDVGITKIHWHIGYTPSVFGASANTIPNLAGFTEAQTFALFAAAWSAAITDFKTRLTAAGYTLSTILAGFTFWNEPDATGFWNQAVTATAVQQLKDLWVACAQKFKTDHPDLPNLGAPEMSGWTTTTGAKQGDMPRAILAASQTAGAGGTPLPPSLVPFHNYKGETYQILELLKAARKETDTYGAGYTSIPVALTEVGIIIGTAAAALTGSQRTAPVVQRGILQGAFMHGLLAELCLDPETTKVDRTFFFRLGQQHTYSVSSGSEEEMGAWNRANPPGPLPTGGVYLMLWEHNVTGATRVPFTLNTDRIQAIVTKQPSGKIVATFSSYKLVDFDRLNPFRVSIPGLPSTFTWRQEGIDFRDGDVLGDGRPIFRRSGTQADLPMSLDVTNVGVVKLTITP